MSFPITCESAGQYRAKSGLSGKPIAVRQVVSASYQTYSTCSGSPGTGTPQASVPGLTLRETEKSFKPDRSSASISGRQIDGVTKSGFASKCASSRSVYLLKAKK